MKSKPKFLSVSISIKNNGCKSGYKPTEEFHSVAVTNLVDDCTRYDIYIYIYIEREREREREKERESTGKQVALVV
jgi:hypothetical protein